MSIELHAERPLWVKSSYSSGEGGACVEVAWTKSSYSSDQGGACVEVAWTKSSYSGDHGGACIEVASRQGEVRVRDSKVVDGVQLVVRPEAWEAFVSLAARA